MYAIKHYLPLCWLEGNPLDLPESKGFLKLNIAFYGIVQYFLQANMTDDPIESFTEVLAELILTLVFVAVMLLFDRKLKAYIQVSTAIFFCTNALSLFVIPVIVWLTVTDTALSYYVMSIVVLWFFALITHIFRSALAINTIASLALSLLYFVVVYLGAVGLGQM
jgi:small-conductance mechanosensitive channel